MLGYCELCGHIGGHAYNCPNGPEAEPVDKCTECGEPLYNGDPVYLIGDMRMCQACIDDCKTYLDVEPYSYEDYLQDRYEEERHDAEL